MFVPDLYRISILTFLFPSFSASYDPSARELHLTLIPQKPAPNTAFWLLSLLSQLFRPKLNILASKRDTSRLNWTHLQNSVSLSVLDFGPGLRFLICKMEIIISALSTPKFSILIKSNAMMNVNVL